MYLPKYINNRLCAPNRLYISIDNSLPVIVNKDNPVLNNYITQYNFGYFIEDISDDFFFNIKKDNIIKLSLDTLKNEQIKNFIDLYKVYLT